MESVADEDKAAVAQVAAEFLQEDLPEQQFGAPKAGAGMWASVIRVFDPIKVGIRVKLPACDDGRVLVSSFKALLSKISCFIQ